MNTDIYEGEIVMELADEPTLRDQLLADYDQHEDAIERASNAELWALGDWLAEYVPPRHPGPQGRDNRSGSVISLEDLTARGRRGLDQLQILRKVALTTEVDRLPQITITAYHEALRATKWDLMAANQRLLDLGHRKRDQRTGPHESLKAITREASKRPPEDRAELVRELTEDPTVRELLDGEPLPDFGAAWADLLVVRVDLHADNLAKLVKREGLVFSPGSDLPGFLEMLERAERQIAEVRAAVYERVQDARMEGVS